MSLKGTQLLKETARRDAFTKGVGKMADDLFDLQRKVYDSKAKRIHLGPGRRGGKTTVAPAVVLRAAAKFPRTLIPVCQRALTTAATSTFWREMQEANDRYDLGMTFRHTVKEATCPNGARVQLFGVDTLELADKLRGEAYPAVFVDECGTYRSHVLEFLIDDVLKAAFADYDGVLYTAGTPGPKRDKKSYWYRVSQGDLAAAYEHHHWTCLENPELGKQKYQRSRAWREKWLSEQCIISGWMGGDISPNGKVWADEPPAYVIAECKHPKFLREFMGQWVDSFTDAFYEYTEGCLIGALPETNDARPWRYGLSIDLGYNDPTAFVVTATRAQDPRVYVIESFQKTGMIPSTIAVQIARYQMAYGTFHFIVADTGGGGKMAVEEMNAKYQLAIQAAKKPGKMVYREHVNGDFRTGAIAIVRATNEDLIADLAALRLNDQQSDAHPDDADHLPDAFLYGHRHWTEWSRGLEGLGILEQDAPKPFSAEWWRLQDVLEEQRAERISAELQKTDEDEELSSWGDDPQWDEDYK